MEGILKPIHITTSPHKRQAPGAQKDVHDRRLYEPSLVLAIATIVDGATVKPMP